MRRLAASHVLVVGLGGVGAYAAEEIARAGVGRMTLVDADVVSLSNLNRQLPALHSTLGKPKAEVMAARLRDINPDLEVEVRNCFVRDEETEALLDAAHYDFVVDAIDTLSPKTFLIYHALQRHLPIISSMGAGAKVDPSRIRIADISKTTDCALARAVRKRLRGMGISSGLPVVFSTEPANPQAILEVEDEACKRTTTGTVSYMPALFGCYLASYVIRHLSQTD
jgi:tRNA A37 threonylcarbamoyladenosine dehydratase